MQNFGVREAYVVYDHPPEFFRPPSLPERHDLFTRLSWKNQDFADAVRASTSDSFRPGGGHPALSRCEIHEIRSRKRHKPPKDDVWEPRGDSLDYNLFTTRRNDGTYEMRRHRPALLVSSTSWTPDEDFSILLEALMRLDARAASGASPSLPFVVVVVTGKGPDKAKYMERMKAAKMSKVAVCTAWLEPDDYPILLGSADLGICLHTSTSGEGR